MHVVGLGTQEPARVVLYGTHAGACHHHPPTEPAARVRDLQSPTSNASIVASSNSSASNPIIDGVMVPPGLPPPPGLPSHGSVLHGTERCKPCRWFYKSSGCELGQDCGHCHLCPASEITLRRKRRMQRKLQERREISHHRASLASSNDASTQMPACAQLDTSDALSESSWSGKSQ